MKWVDYREKLGIGFNDPQKFQALKNLFMLFFDQCDFSRTSFSGQGFLLYYKMVGEHLPSRYNYYDIRGVETSVLDGLSMFEVVSKFVALINTAKDIFVHPGYGELLLKVLNDNLIQLNIQYETMTDADGVFVFPKGVQEFDYALVSTPLDWLKDYPNAEKAWSRALREYSETTPDNASNVADLFRKALETFFQEFFKVGDGRTLENSKADYGRFLKENGVPAEVSNNLETLLQAYTNYMSNYAKHTDKAKINVLEYLMYQTGNIVRLVIMLKRQDVQ